MNSTEVKKIEDFLGLYLGCECEFVAYETGNKFRRVLLGIDIDYFTFEAYKRNPIYKSITPILRPLSSMSEEEAGMIYMFATDEIDFRADDVWYLHKYKNDFDDSIASIGIRNSKRSWWEVNIDSDFNVLKYEDDDVPHIEARHKNQHEITRYLLSKGFDIFNLRESGLCIYEDDLKT